jgi:hypothetical protein
MPSFEMLHRVALIRTDVSEERSASIIRVTSISELGRTLAVTSNRRELRRNILVVYSFPRNKLLDYVLVDNPRNKFGS